MATTGEFRLHASYLISLEIYKTKISQDLVKHSALARLAVVDATNIKGYERTHTWRKPKRKAYAESSSFDCGVGVQQYKVEFRGLAYFSS